MRERYRPGVGGYVVMPEDLHALISEAQIGNPSTVVEKLKYMYRNPVVRGLMEKLDDWPGAVSGLTRMAKMVGSDQRVEMVGREDSGQDG